MTDAEATAAALNARGAIQPCARCGNGQHDVTGFTLLPTKDNAHDPELGGPASGAALLACTRCGLINLHSTAILGIRPAA